MIRLGAHINLLGAMRRLRFVGIRMVCAVASLLGLSLTGCRIEPPLRLPDDINLAVGFAEVITDIDVIWDSDGSWRDMWWYGWDAEDIRRWGEIAYPEPTNYEARFYYVGDTYVPGTWIDLQKLTVYDKTIRRRFDFGYHDMLVWSNIDSPDGTQVLLVDETDQSMILATTTRSRLSYNVPSRGTPVHNNPEIFYSGALDDIYISPNIEDYDYYDEATDTWIKQLNTTLYPLVYIYMVQVVVYNNHGRIVDLGDNASISNLAEGVYLHSGKTIDSPINNSYEMGFKHDLPAREGRIADIFGGKMTTFGLCDMEPWSKSRGAEYRGSRSELNNHLSLLFKFNNATDSAYHFNITDQMRRQAHGGVITVEIDADTIRIPNTSNLGNIFDPTIVPTDSIEHVFPM